MRRALALALVLSLVWSCKQRTPAASDHPAAAAPPESTEAPDPREALAAANSARGGSQVVATLNFTETDRDISGPDSAAAGAVRIHLVNRGAAIHELRLMKLGENTIVGGVMPFIAEGGQLPAGLTPAGGAGPLPPGQSMDVVQMLGPGDYLVFCRLRGPDDKPWFTRGVRRMLRITGSLPSVPQPPVLEARSAIITSERGWKFGITLQTSPGRSILIEGSARRTSIPPGENIIMLENFGGPGHDAVLIRADEPRAMRRYIDWLAGAGGDPPRIIGGLPGLFAIALEGGSSRMRAYLSLTLERGAYIIFCPRKNSAAAYDYELGEYAQFIVQ